MYGSYDVLNSVRQVNRILKRNPKNKRFHHGAFRILRALSEHERLRASELASILDIRPPSVTDCINKLETLGLVERARDDADSRSVWVSITEQGREELRKKNQYYDELSNHIKKILTQEEQELFCTVCRKLIDDLEKLSGEDEA